jgi:hypothetical protein
VAPTNVNNIGAAAVCLACNDNIDTMLSSVPTFQRSPLACDEASVVAADWLVLRGCVDALACLCIGVYAGWDEALLQSSAQQERFISSLEGLQQSSAYRQHVK